MELRIVSSLTTLDAVIMGHYVTVADSSNPHFALGNYRRNDRLQREERRSILVA